MSAFSTGFSTAFGRGTTSAMLGPFRDAIEVVLAGAPWTVHRYLPDDVGDLPCIAIMRPSLSVGDPSTVVDGECPVLVVGSRLGDYSAQRDLDAVTDAVIERLGAIARPLTLEGSPVMRLALDAVSPTSVVVGGSEYPAYELTLTAVINPGC